MKTKEASSRDQDLIDAKKLKKASKQILHTYSSTKSTWLVRNRI
jgi:hypothetical protein